MTTKVWHYQIPSKNLEGWAQIFITERGVFSAVSDWGNYGYVWTHTGHDDVREFFVRDSWADQAGYFVEKFDPTKAYDADETEAAVRELLKKNGWGSVAIDELLEQHDISSEVGFAWLVDNKELETVVRCWLCTCAQYTHSRQATQFVLKVMPQLTELIRAQLAEERAGTVSP